MWRWDGRYGYTETVGGVVVAEGERQSPIPPRTCAVAVALACGALLAVASADDVARIVLPTAAIGLVGLVFLLMGVSLWRNVDRETATIERATQGAPRGGDLVGTAFPEGPAEAVTQGFYSLFSIRGLVRYSAIALDIVELVGYAALTLLMLFALLTADRETPVGSILFVLALYAISIGVGLWLGLLDGWIDIVEYVF